MQEDLKVCRFETELSDLTDTVFNCVVPYIHDCHDRSSVSLVCRKWCELDGVTRKHVTVAVCYSTKPVRLCERFPLLESLTVKGKPRAAMFDLIPEDWGGYVTPWVREIVSSLKCLKAIHFRRMIVRDSDIDLLTRTRGQELRVLKLDLCSGFSTDGLLQIGKLCNNLKTLYLQESLIVEKDGEWLHELALHNKAMESLNFYMTDLVKFDLKDLELIAKNCSGSLVSVKISECDVTDLVDFFRYAVKLEEFGGGAFSDHLEKYAGLKFPPILRSMALNYMSELELPVVLPFASQITKLDLLYALFDTDAHCFLFQRCPNLEVLDARDVIGDRGLQVLGQFCKKLCRIKIERGDDEEGLVSQRGLIDLAQGCLELECLHVNLTDITNEALECVGTHLKKLYDFRMILLDKEERITELPLDNGVQALLCGCSRLERLGIYLRPGGLTDVGLGYVGKYAQNVRYMLLGFTGDSDAGLVELSKGCPNLQKLEMRGCGFSEQALTAFVLNVASLRYLWIQGYHATESYGGLQGMARPFWNMELISSDRYVDVQQQPPSLLAYYSLAGQRTDFPESVLPLHPHPPLDLH
ncbi:coronatine-insensitive protein 1-like isoform X1 [Cynara cardunculus var. scolymus]|uniref:Leucine-rich repeat, cysteine-containing subtype n=1 Tax=Cynara cardunculus var. scolymus TaxID=59895 RepID=A0A103YFR9_CYNCS|nr:coronatine-insensitive protein 1-like isoform X1 [Cynara cardunculus var. scolymus]XP_024969777.1 coronatine-insensitive protein 1-like isoform X1 [Cynara cardunculus var. scolymus]KVI08271.1 Leucine-rich repeat, cysteine-containing subtype [Cynara cardunculus var. scolymus]